MEEKRARIYFRFKKKSNRSNDDAFRWIEIWVASGRLRVNRDNIRRKLGIVLKSKWDWPDSFSIRWLVGYGIFILRKQ